MLLHISIYVQVAFHFTFVITYILYMLQFFSLFMSFFRLLLQVWPPMLGKHIVYNPCECGVQMIPFPFP